MNISIFGLGYVGCISLGCLAENGHQVTGVDINEHKVNLIKHGKPTVIEKDIDTIIKHNHEKGRINATMNSKEAVKDSDAAIICVGTPNDKTGKLGLQYVQKVAEEIGQGLKEKDTFYTILIRSTVPPGTNKMVAEAIEKKTGKENCKDFAVVSNPEFLREGAAVKDYYKPPYTVIGSDCPKGIEIAKEIYAKIEAPFEIMDIKGAELLKYVNNSFHALKITFANEVGNIAKRLGIDSHQLMDVFAKDDKLNISKAYLKPGFAYGGSCLPKDLKALNAFSHEFYLNTPVLNAVDKSNQEQIRQAIQMIEQSGKKKLGFVGISFKEGTDDLRFSPTLEVVEYFIGKGYDVKIFDSNVHLSKLTGTNKEYLETKLPHISELLTDNLENMQQEVDVLAIANREDALKKINIDQDKVIIDLVRINELESFKNYKGIAW
ncbi:MAG: nucleotide sugar dehydrogenase [bacterium]